MLSPIYPAMRRFFPKYVATTEDMGRAMINVVRHGAPRRVLEMGDINDSVSGAS
jgi:hypothetical protein